MEFVSAGLSMEGATFPTRLRQLCAMPKAVATAPHATASAGASTTDGAYVTWLDPEEAARGDLNGYTFGYLWDLNIFKAFEPLVAETPQPRIVFQLQTSLDQVEASV